MWSIQPVLPILVTLYEKRDFFKRSLFFLKIRLICCAVPEPGSLTSGFPGFVCRDLKSGMVTAMPKHKAKIISIACQESWQVK